MPSLSRQMLRYFCSKCTCLLKESHVELAASPEETCPQCGSLLSETLHRAVPASRAEEEVWAPKTVFELSAPNFGIAELERLGVRYSTSVCLTGDRSDLLFWRTLVRSLLPQRSSGRGFSRVLLLDAGNCSDMYTCVDFARQMGLSLDRLLDGVVLTRAFTVYQLAALARNLGNAAKKFDAQMVALADMAKLFASDPQVAGVETTIAGRVAASISEISRYVPVIAFMSSFRSEGWLKGFESILQVARPAEGILTVCARNERDVRTAAVEEKKVLLVGQG